ncbi:S-formylglutathione hydrolase [Thalassotalea crassostreae]|uniref:S-formylglutathione hydrolase n=1 Tax=Thalassotalea crassostreae TaxID=1763536 RepID=UPI00083927AD|nr:S-formylglutathione hydrolase [Thalassotalea crassostreae]
MSIELLSENRCFGGRQLRYQHQSSTLDCSMIFSVFLPPQAQQNKVPVLYWLSGLTCTDENFVQKAGAQQYAAEHGIAIVCPDTSPRGDNVADDENGAYDFGLGAGFYVNATEEPFAKHYQMYDYVVNELPQLINENFPVNAGLASISGHSMGGHGALTIALKNSQMFKSVSAFSPITSPLNCPWGEKALTGYVGENRDNWLQYDSCYLLGQAQTHIPMLVDQGTSDNFLQEQLQPERLKSACEQANYEATLRLQEGYDHSYFFISTFIGEHIAFHAKHLKR